MFLNLFSRPLEHAPRQDWAVPSRARCVFAYVAGKRLDLPKEGTPFKTARLVPDVPELSGRRGHLIALACFFKQEVYGFMVFESATDDMVVLGNLATHVSSAYRSVLGYHRLEKSARSLEVALKQLQASNRKLNELSTRDTLTGLYNRRGFELIGEKLHDLARRNESEYLLFFADMDGLKAINDNWGHKAGDDAITACAEILRRTFRSADLVARLGGDEFTVLVAGPGPESVHGILSRLEEALDQHNDRRWGRPYRVELSIGYVFFSACPLLSFSEVMARADAELYRQKHEHQQAGRWPHAV
jgi:diguanylate cyclase (GGDEF)-like protein